MEKQIFRDFYYGHLLPFYYFGTTHLFQAEVQTKIKVTWHIKTWKIYPIRPTFVSLKDSIVISNKLKDGNINKNLNNGWDIKLLFLLLHFDFLIIEKGTTYIIFTKDGDQNEIPKNTKKYIFTFYFYLNKSERDAFSPYYGQMTQMVVSTFLVLSPSYYNIIIFF